MLSSRLTDTSGSSTAEAQNRFEMMLPKIRSFAAYAFRRYGWEQREELIAETVAQAYLAILRLAQARKLAVAYPTPLSRNAVRHVLAGRRVASSANHRQDVLAAAHWRRGSGTLQRLTPNATSGDWEELITDRRATPSELAACRLDFRSWLAQLHRSKRRLAIRLAYGDSTGEAAQHFGVSVGRISQVRQELFASWQAFQGEKARRTRLPRELDQERVTRSPR
jgi:hypothetical protein